MRRRLGLVASVAIAVAGCPGRTKPLEPIKGPDKPPAGVPSWTVDVIDVGTGLAIFVRGQDFTLLYDGGSNDDLALGANNRLVAFLKENHPKLAQIDHVILSHPHRDHVELLADVLATYRVASVWDSGRVNDICGYRTFVEAVMAEPEVSYRTARFGSGTHGVGFGAKRCYGEDWPAVVHQVRHGERIETGLVVPLGTAASMKFLHADGDSTGSPNENSLVVRLELGGRVVLLMGDAEGGDRKTWPGGPRKHAVEGQLLACCKADLDADVLIVGHHGSRTSSRAAFLDAVSATVFVVSSGPVMYGAVRLPDDEVIEALEHRGRVLRTDVRDDACATNPTKTGADADGKPGGCTNHRITIDASDVTIKNGNLE